MQIDGRGYIIVSVYSLPDRCKPESVAAMSDPVKIYGKY